MTLILSQEFKKCLNLATPAILFFVLPAKQKIEILPTLNQEKIYDFSDRYFLTHNALEVLIMAYGDCLNKLVIRLDDFFFCKIFTYYLLLITYYLLVTNIFLTCMIGTTYQRARTHMGKAHFPSNSPQLIKLFRCPISSYG